MKRKFWAALMAAGIVSASGLLAAAPAHATPSPSCWAGVTATTGIGSCQGATNGGSYYRVHVTCREFIMIGFMLYGRTSHVGYASPGQPGIVIQTPPCPPGSTPSNAQVVSW